MTGNHKREAAAPRGSNRGVPAMGRLFLRLRRCVAFAHLLLGFHLLGASMVHAASPLNGTWYNSFCSRVDLTVDQDGLIDGRYTSHTGSTGTSIVSGLVNPALQPQPGVPANPKGIPFGMGIQWRLVNVPISRVDGSWHWVSSFSGQYHQKQTVSAGGQKPYVLEETLVLLNGLIATATLPPLAETAPLMWPQSLEFHRTPPSYCGPVTPGEAVPYTPSAQDNLTGAWRSGDGGVLNVAAILELGLVVGQFTDKEGNQYAVSGLFDTIAPGSGEAVPWQGVTLSFYDSSKNRLKGAAGGIDYSNPSRMWLWTSDVQSTTWTDRFTQQTLDKTLFEKLSE